MTVRNTIMATGPSTTSATLVEFPPAAPRHGAAAGFLRNPASPTSHFPPGAPPPKRTIIFNNRQAQNQRQQIEKPIIPRRQDQHLQRRNPRQPPFPQPPRPQDSTGQSNSATYTKKTESFSNHPALGHIPTRPRRQRLCPIVVIQRREIRPGRIVAENLYQPRQKHQPK